MAEQSVTLNPGESKVVSFEATPREAKVYQVSVDGLSGSFVAVEAPAAEFAYVSAIRQTTYYTSAHGRSNELAVTVEIDIQNQGDAPGVCAVSVERSLLMEIFGTEYYFDWRDTGWKEGLLSATLQPGQVLTFWDNCRRHVGGRVIWEKLRFNGSPGISDWVYEI